jgi:hypothetical protein
MAAERQQKAKRGAPPSERNDIRSTDITYGIGRTQVVLNVAVDAEKFKNKLEQLTKHTKAVSKLTSGQRSAALRLSAHSHNTSHHQHRDHDRSGHQDTSGDQEKSEIKTPRTFTN